MRFALASLLALAASATSAAELRPMTHEDMWRMWRPTAPVLSADGQQAVVPVTEAAYSEKEQRVDLWWIDPAGKRAARRLTQDAAAEAAPQFSPDGRHLIFAAQRPGDTAPQLYRMSFDGGDAERLTEVVSGVRTPQYSPDGRKILFVSSVFRDSKDLADHARIAKEREALPYKVRAYEGFPIRNWDRWLDDRQLRLYVLDLETRAITELLSGSDLLRKSGYGGRFSETGEELDATWTPDSQGVVFAATDQRHRAAYSFTASNLYLVNLGDLSLKQLTGQAGVDGTSWGRPRFAPDGRVLYALMTLRSGKIYDASELGRLSWPAAQELPPIVLPEGKAVSSFAISPNSRDIFLSVEENGLEVVYLASGDGRKLAPWSNLSEGVTSNLVANTRGKPVLLATQDAAHRPAEIVRVESRGAQPVTAFNSPRAAALDLPPVEHFWFDAADGTRIHNMLVKPANFDPQRKYPLFVLIHGGPHIMWRDTFFVRWNYHLLAGQEYVILLTNYKGSTGFGEAFAQSIQGDPLKGPADQINQAADEAIARYAYIDGTRQCAGGASYGGHLANWLQGTTTRYRCLVSHAGLVNLEAQWGTSDTIYGREVSAGGPPWEQGAVWREQNPIRLGANFKTPVLVTFGELDYRVPINNGLEYWSALQRMQVESRLLVFPDENHWIQKGENSRYFYSEVRGWLARYLGP